MDVRSSEMQISTNSQINHQAFGDPIPQSFCKQAMESLPSAVLMLDGDRNIVFANLLASNVLRRDIDDLVGRRIDELNFDLHNSHQRPGDFGSDLPHRCRYVAPDGTKLVVGYRVSGPICFGRSDVRAHRTIIFQDITHIEHLREERDRLLQLGAVGEVLPAVLHELKNPLAAIATAVEVLVEEIEPGHVQNDLHAVLTEVRRMKLTFDGIGLMNQSMHTRELFAIDFAIVEAFRVLEARMKAAGIEPECKVRAMPVLPLNAAAVRAIVFNLVTNALHACERGDRIMIEAFLSADGDVLELRIADTGCGMDAETLEHCRQLFFTTKRNGSGMGLPLCESVVRKAKGELLINSEPGIGTTIVIRIPLIP